MSYQSCEIEGLFVIRWGVTPERRDVKAYAAELEAARSRQGRPLVGLFIMPPNSKPPDEDFRKVQAEYLPDIMANFEFAIAVFEGTGFFSSLKRSALVAILLLAPRRYSIYVRPTVEDALIRNPPRPLRFDARKAVAELQHRGLLATEPVAAAAGT
jgi:hypothetical protein